VAVSILLPCNAVNYFENALESILKQQFPLDQIQLVIVANGIELDTLNQFDYGELKQNLVLLQTPPNGLVSALNFGLSACDADFVARMDQDDEMTPFRLAKQVTALEADDQLSAIGGQLVLINSLGEVIGKASYNSGRRLNKSRFQNSPLAHPAVTFRKTRVLQVGGYRTNIVEDWDLWMRLFEVGKIDNLKDTVLRYRVHKNQMSRSKLYELKNAKSMILTSHVLRSHDYVDLPGSAVTGIEWISQIQMSMPSLGNEIEKVQIKYSKEERFLDKIGRIRVQPRMTSPIRFILLLLMNPSISIALVLRKIRNLPRR
jgi:glycosyltransferase involved in cell wall biosynthesis